MRISRQYKFIYYSIPKTASESVRLLLKPLSDVPIVRFKQVSESTPFYNHMRPIEALSTMNKDGIELTEYMSFATVRNPWARMVSLYQMMARERVFQSTPNFLNWLNTIDSENLVDLGFNAKWLSHGMLNYETFLAPADSISHIFRIEDGLTALINLLKEHCDLPNWTPPHPHLNANPASTAYKDLYNSAAIKRVSILFENDIDRFKYRFDD